ncbi:MAG: hypothetical protein JW713_09245 [Pontiellaceae bacterium]|nr:hypothetical protein [Pontiellaceae bacterium]
MRFTTLRILTMALPCSLLIGVAHAAVQFDFGAAGTESGYTAVGTTTYSAGTGYGWVSSAGLNLRDRSVPDDLRTDFIYATSASSVFRISGLTPGGKYRLTVIAGDADYGNHVTTVGTAAGALATLTPGSSEYAELTASVNADASGTLDVSFTSSINNWVVNALTLEATTDDVSPTVESTFVSEWDASVFAENPTTNLLNGFNGSGAADFSDTGLTRNDYLTLIAGEIDFWKTKQNSSGAIIDPYRGSETQYSTPAFANAAAALVVYADRSDLLEAAALAMDWASYRLSINAAADGHDDFYPGMLANAYRLLSPLVGSSRAAMWAANLGYDPFAIYDYAPGSFNWTVVSSCGDALLQLLGIRSSDNPYVSVCWGAQGRHFTSPYGLYMEGPMAYDHFPRIWWEDAIAQGYDGPYTAEVSEAMDRAAITSLFMQSPWGELPAGGRSAHHQWNEAEQCVTFEIYAGKARDEGDLLMAAAYKRAAHLSLASMLRWVRPSGEMQIVKNHVDPASRHGYESYSYHSQYNILPMAMLAIAYEHAALSEDVAEGPAPADTGGFVFQVSGLNKVFANAGGTYVELDTSADHHYDATGLIRIHQKGVSPQLGPSDSLLASAGYNSPDPSPITTGVGISWLDSDGTTWRTLGEMSSSEITDVNVVPVSQSTTQVVFEVTYSGSLPNVTAITEHYVVTPAGVALTTELTGYSGALRYVWPVLSNDGATGSMIAVNGDSVSVSQGGAAVTFTANGADNVSVGSEAYSNHNGWARLGMAEYSAGGAVTLQVSRDEPDVNILSTSPAGDIYDATPVLNAVIEDGDITVDPDQVVLILDGNSVALAESSKVGSTTTVSAAVSTPLTLGVHTAGLVAGPGMPTNEWIFTLQPLPTVRLGDITYVDASSGAAGNTMQWNGSDWSTFSPPYNISSSADDQWEEETGYGNGASYNWFESNREGTEDCPQLRTLVSGLPDRTYAVYAYFWVAAGQGFKFGASLTGNPAASVPLFNVSSTDVAAAGSADFSTSVVVASGDRTLYQVSLGTVSGTDVAVYVDDEADGGYNSSCWYDGIGYARNVATTPADLSVDLTNESATVSWPQTHQGWILQSTANLPGNNWADVEGSNSNVSWSIPFGGVEDSAFFRIRYPLP